MSQIRVIGLDLAKQVFQVHAIAADGSVVVKRQLRRSQVLTFFSKLEPCLVGLEACGGAHFWAREIAAFGHHVRLMPPAYVKPYVKRGKTDAGDAEAICEAVCRPTMRFVPVKTAAQQSEAMVLKIRNLIVRQRNQTINALRAHLSEFGIVAGVGISRVADLIAVVRDTDDTRLPGEARAVLAGLAEQLEALGARLRRLDEEIILKARQDADMRRLATVPGIGPISVENAIAPMLPHGKVRAEVIARQLGMSERTLARRFAEEGLDFSEILRELRRDLAMRYLNDGEHHISKIAWLLGFHEVSAFSHAFKQWTGLAPSQMRLGGGSS